MGTAELNEKNKSREANFIIEDNIIKGRETTDTADRNSGEIFLKIFDEHADKIGQIEVETGRQTTYAEMKKNSIRCALYMRKMGIGPGDVVTVCTHNQLDAYVPCFATFLVGAIYNPWHDEVTLRAACYFLDLTKPKLVFVCEKSTFNLQIAACMEELEECSFVVFGEYTGVVSLEDVLDDQTEEEIESFVPTAVDDFSNIAMIVFSSGTTGNPKGVALPYSLIIANITNIALLPFKECNFLWYSTLYWISGTLCMFQCFKYGFTRIIHNDSDPHKIGQLIEKYKVNMIFMSPTTLTRCKKSNAFLEYDTTSLKMIIAGGAKLSPETLTEFKQSIPHTYLCLAYGMTELGEVAIMQSPKCKIVDSVGFVSPNAQLKVIGIDTGETLGPNEQGEILMKTPTMFVEYYKNPEATQEVVDQDGWLHTGDKGYFTEEGEVVVVDRLKEVMKFRGHHVSPSEIEEVLIKHPAVMEVAVVPIPHELDIERPMAFVKTFPGSKVTEEELVELSSELGELKKLWGGVKFLKEMPYTASMKISRKDLKEMARALAADTPDL